MDRIPAEIWHEIFIKLVLKDRIQCLFVCRNWYNMLDKGSLLYDLDVHYHKLKDMLERFPYKSTQTQYLTIRLYSTPEFDKREVCNIFPNLRELKLKGGQFVPFRDYLSRPFHLTNSTLKLEAIEDCYECELTHQLVLSNLCKYLKILELNHMYSRDRADITQLKNMPVLEHLRLTGTPVTLMSLEIMHHNLPTIKSLHLRVHLRSGDTPRNVLAASLITTLKISICTAEDLHTHLQFYKYIYSKYPSVMDVTYNDEHELVDVDVDYVRDIYNEGILPLYQRVEFQTDTFYFGDYCDGLDAFRKFDGFGIKLKYLGIETYRDDVVLRLADLTQSQQSKYIETLALQNVIPEPIHLMKNMMALTCMEIATVYSDGGPYCEELLAIDFNQLVDACPASLTDLTLSRLDLTFNEPTSNQTSITYLNLSDLCLEPALAKTIETSFPQLSELEFDGEIQHGTIISLPNHNLEFVDIKIIIWQIGRYGFVVTTTSDNRVEYYDENGQLGSNNDDTHLPREDFDGGPVLSLTCASVNCLSLKTVSLLQVKYNKLNK